MKKNVVFAVLLTLVVPQFSIAKNKTVSVQTEPAPSENDDRNNTSEDKNPRNETYEGNDRGGNGGAYDDGGYGGNGGMGGELFRTANGSYFKQTIEDRGSVLVIKSQVLSSTDSSELCSVYTENLVDKVTKKVLKTETNQQCY